MVGGRLDQPVAVGRLAAGEAVQGRAALGLAHPLLEGKIFRIALGELRHLLVALRQSQTALRFGLGQFRFDLGKYFHERGT